MARGFGAAVGVVLLLIVLVLVTTARDFNGITKVMIVVGAVFAGIPLALLLTALVALVVQKLKDRAS